MLEDPSITQKLMKMIKNCVDAEEEPISTPLPERGVRHVGKKKRTSREFKFFAEIGGYDMENVIMDLGSYVNILPKKSWEQMGKPKLVWFLVQLRLANQYQIYPIGRLEKVQVSMDGVESIADFEVIEIVDEIDPYPSLLGIDWAFDNSAIIDLKRRTMTFESNTPTLITPLDPRERARHTELVREDLDNYDVGELYNITARREDYVNPTMDGELSWRSICSYGTDAKDALNRWQNRLHEVSTRRCVCVTK